MFSISDMIDDMSRPEVTERYDGAVENSDFWREKIKLNLKLANLSISWLAKRIGTSRQNVFNWLNGTEPGDPSIWPLLNAAIPVKELDKPLIPVGFSHAKLKHAGTVPAGVWGDPLESTEFIELDVRFEHPKRFAAFVAGESCYPALRQGDLTVWHHDHAPQYGLIVLAQRRGDHNCTVKQLAYSEEEHRPALKAINPLFTQSIEETDGWGVIARLVAVIRDNDGLEHSWFLQSGLRPNHLAQ